MSGKIRIYIIPSDLCRLFYLSYYFVLFCERNIADQILHLKIKRVPRSNRRCAFPACVASRGLKNLLQVDRCYLDRVCKICVRSISRVCAVHANRFLWQNSDVQNESNDFWKEHIEDMFHLLTENSIHFETPLVFSK